MPLRYESSSIKKRSSLTCRSALPSAVRGRRIPLQPRRERNKSFSSSHVPLPFPSIPFYQMQKDKKHRWSDNPTSPRSSPVKAIELFRDRAQLSRTVEAPNLLSKYYQMEPLNDLLFNSFDFSCIHLFASFCELNICIMLFCDFWSKHDICLHVDLCIPIESIYTSQLLRGGTDGRRGRRRDCRSSEGRREGSEVRGADEKGEGLYKFGTRAAKSICADI